jgi:bifunctional non-homologous end joining protein LigD
MSLHPYRKKRDFTKTAEPAGKVEKTRASRFVIQKHAASRLHYDFRLEIDGVLKSWAVPKGIPYAKGERHLAVEVEDHPVSYIRFEGTIPKGQYGGGTVMVWDEGTFTPDGPNPTSQLKQGKLHFTLRGKKLSGRWHLVRMSDPKQWLLIKSEESMPPLSSKQDDSSAISNRTMDQIASKTTPQTTPVPRKSAPKTKILPFVEPMKALLIDHPPTGQWLYEIKFDGYRALAFKNGSQTSLLSRNNKDFSTRFPEIHHAISQLPAPNAVVDGEIVALDSHGHSSFQTLQAYQLGEEKPPLTFYVFDLLWLNGQDLRAKPLEIRRNLLKQTLKNAPDTLRFSESFDEKPQKLLAHARKLGLEGLIAKRPGSLYETGRRSGAWIKLKLNLQQEFIIGGYTPPGGSRKYFGSLILGVRNGKSWQFTGKVGTGFTHASLAALHKKLLPLATDHCPFANLPLKKSSHYGTPLTASEMSRCTWVKPQLVAQIKFTAWTRDAMLRHPVFLGLREDKKPADVIRETPKP